MFYLAINREIQLRTLRPDDVEDLYLLIERNRSRLRPWIHPSALPATMAASRELIIESYCNSLSDPMEALAAYNDYQQELERDLTLLNQPLDMGIWVGDMLAGQIMLVRLQESLTTAELGYWIDGEKEGQGIITLCVSGLMDYAIDDMGIERFIIGCAANNRRSRAIPERLGYRLLASVPDGEVVGDFIYDRLIYEMQANTWCEPGRRRMQRASVADSR
jgi:ribosomal-protein-serine acetyltransferase